MYPMYIVSARSGVLIVALYPIPPSALLIAEQKIGLRRLDEVGPVHFSRRVSRKRKDRRVITACLMEAGDQMGAARAGGAGTHNEPASQLGLAGPASAAPSAWRTPIHSMRLRRIASASGFKESPINPNMCLTPTCSSTPTRISATV
jgi:hypothetical protein